MNKDYRFLPITLKTVIIHTVTYFIMGSLSSAVFDYGTIYTETALSLLMRPLTHPLVIAGVLFQPIRGLLFGTAFYLMRHEFFGRPRGWLSMWAVLVIIGILSTFGPSPGSIEGMVYTSLPMNSHLTGQLEVWVQSLLLSLLTYLWVTRPVKKWINILAGCVFVICLLLPIMGLLAASAI